MFRSLRAVVRRWRRAPIPFVVSVTSLALGVTAMTVVFGAVRAILFRPIPGTHAPELIRIQGADGTDPLLAVSYPEFEALADVTSMRLAAERVNTARVVAGGGPHSVGVAAVTPGYFDVLGVRFAAGGGFAAGGEPVAVVSEGFWRARLAADPQVLSKSVAINGRDYPIRGVAARGFEGAFPLFRVDVWVPLDEVERVLPEDGSPTEMDARFLNVLGRMPVGIGEAALQDRLDAAASSLRPLPSFSPERRFRIDSARGTHSSIKAVAAVTLTVMFAISGVVLLVAGANVASILLAQGVGRRAELALRLCLGASRWSLIRALLAESVVLGLAGGLVGLGASALALRLVSSLRPPLDVPLGLNLVVDVPIVAFAASAGMLTGVAFGILPALRASSRAPARDVRSGGLGSGTRGRWIFQTLVIAQTAAATVLVAGAALMLRGLGGLDDLDPGFRRTGVITVAADLPGWTNTQREDFWSRVREVASGLPGVEGSAMALFVHLGDRADQRRVRARGAAEEWLPTPVNYSIAETDLFALLDIRMTRGRAFDSGLTEADPLEVIVNEELALRLWPGADPLGRTLEFDDPEVGPRSAQVVGVTQTVKYRRPDEAPTPFFYFSSAQVRRSGMVLHLRTAQAAEAATLSALRRATPAIAPKVPTTVRRMTDHVRVPEVVARMVRSLLLHTGSAALAIAVSGVFGVVSFLTAQRVPELAVRLAVGASPAGVRRMVVLDMLRFLTMGVVAGLILTTALASRVSGLLYGADSNDPVTLLSAAAIVLAAGGAAAWLPAARATRRENLTQSLRSS